VYLFLIMLITGDLSRGMAFCSMVGLPTWGSAAATGCSW
jgi:hypothetical protein